MARSELKLENRELVKVLGAVLDIIGGMDDLLASGRTQLARDELQRLRASLRYNIEKYKTMPRKTI